MILLNQKKKNKEQVFKNILENYNFDLSKTKHGYGTSIKGNVARALYKDCKKFSLNTGISEEVLVCFSKLSACLRTKKMIDVCFFKKFCQMSIEIWNRDLKGINLTPTIHKVLHHGYEVIDFFQNNFNCGIGFFTEESSESLNHFLKQARLKSRKNTRLNLNNDTFRNILARTCSLVPDDLNEDSNIDISEFLLDFD